MKTNIGFGAKACGRSDRLKTGHTNNRPLIFKALKSLIIILSLLTLTSAVWGQSLLYTLDDPEPNGGGAFGSSLAAIGDVDGDTLPDIAIGAYIKDFGGADSCGQAFVFSGADGSLLYGLNNPNPRSSSYFGAKLAGVGDITGDSVPDIAVGDAYFYYGSRGRVYVFSGMDGSLNYTLDNPYPENIFHFSRALAGIGDVNGDSVPDIAVTAAKKPTPSCQYDGGRVYVYSGIDYSEIYIIDDPMICHTGSFGDRIAALGDVNNDSVSDIVVGAWEHGELVEGKAFVFSGVDGSLLYTIDHPYPQFWAAFGRGLAGIGDVDGDSVPDIIVAAASQDVAGKEYQGQAFVFSGLDGSLLYILNNPYPQAGAGFGDSPMALSDLNADSVPDIAIGAPDQDDHGAVFVFSGVDGSFLTTLNHPNPQIGAMFGGAMVNSLSTMGTTSIAVGAGRQNVDGNTDQGQAYVFNLAENTPPEVVCKDVTVTTESGLCSADALVDDGSFDPDGDPITLDQTPPGPYDLGNTDVTQTVTDDKGLFDTCDATVTVVDEEDPVISSVFASPNKLWPPNHKMVPVTVAVDATDNCDFTCQIISVARSEPVNELRDGDTAPDWIITGDLTVKLRAERSGKGNGRVYTITVECADSSENSSTDTAKVTVPHDKDMKNRWHGKKSKKYAKKGKKYKYKGKKGK